MSEGYERWHAVDAFVESTLIGSDAALEQAQRAAADASLPAIAVTPAQGKLLYLVARVHGARRILEVGTLGGYSTIWLARALPEEGRLVTLELQPSYAEVAVASVAGAGLSDVVEQRVGPAAEAMRSLIAEAVPPFDLIFIDADKPSTPEYFELGLLLCRTGGLVIVDNVVRGGALGEPDGGGDAGAAGMRRLHELIAGELGRSRGVTATTIQTVGDKGYDGFTVALVEG